jgi:hypothetical protein
MLKTLFATSALASMLAVSAYAQNAPAADSQPAPPAAQAPAAETPIVPESAQGEAPAPADNMAAEPATPAPADNMAAEPATPAPADNMAAEPETPAPADNMAAEPETPAPADNVAAEPQTPAPADNMAAEPTLEEGWSKVDVATISADQLIGAKIRGADNTDIAEVQDVLFSADNKLDHVVARFGGFLGFGETTVLLDPSEVTVAKDADGTMYVLTSLTPDQIKGRPEYKAPEPAAAPAAPDAG